MYLKYPVVVSIERVKAFFGFGLRHSVGFTKEDVVFGRDFTVAVRIEHIAKKLGGGV